MRRVARPYPAAPAPRQHSAASPLALAYAALVVYGSLYPFADWRWPPGVEFVRLLQLPWPHYAHHWLPFDFITNLLGYMPLGALLFGARVRRGADWRISALRAVALASMLSYTMEVTQSFVPMRVPSLIDWALNTGGAALGALLGIGVQRLGWVDSWQATRERWFLRQSAGALSLLALWPVALLFPAPVALGLGQVGERLRETLLAFTDDVPWAAGLQPLLESPWSPDTPLLPVVEGLATALGLLAPCLVAYAVSPPGWRRAPLAIGIAGLALATVTLSTALNFGPEHALAWLSPGTLPALACGLVAALLLVPAGPRLAAALGLVALTGLVALVSQAPADPYFADSLQAWEQGRFIRFHGLAQWVGWLWPYAAMAWLLARLAGTD
jgi:VanZ family protein